MNVSLTQHWSKRNRANHDWYDKVALCALRYSIPRPAFQHAILEIEVHYTVKQRGRRKVDASNIVKCTEDALVLCGILTDDSFPHLMETRLRARPATADQVILTIRASE
jgi:Holliday junction resolvase RusA-like endonuclease